MLGVTTHLQSSTLEAKARKPEFKDMRSCLKKKVVLKKNLPKLYKAIKNTACNSQCLKLLHIC